MKIGVLLKQVPDTETRIRLTADGKAVDESTIKWVVNPYDEYAVEEAIKLKEKEGGEVVVISAGPPRTVEALRSALAMGADSGVRIDTGEMLLDSALTAKIFKDVIKDGGFDIVFAGKQAVDDDCAQVVQATSELLGWPSVPVIEKFEYVGGKAIVQRPMGGSLKEMLEVELPAIFGCEKDLNKPRYASLPGIMKAKNKTIVEKAAKDILGGEGVKVEMVKLEFPPERKAGKKVEGDPEDVAEQFVKFLKDDIKII